MGPSRKSALFCFLVFLSGFDFWRVAWIDSAFSPLSDPRLVTLVVQLPRLAGIKHHERRQPYKATEASQRRCREITDIGWALMRVVIDAAAVKGPSTAHSNDCVLHAVNLRTSSILGISISSPPTAAKVMIR